MKNERDVKCQLEPWGKSKQLMFSLISCDAEQYDMATFNLCLSLQNFA